MICWILSGNAPHTAKVLSLKPGKSNQELLNLIITL